MELNEHLHFFKKSIWLIRIEHLVARHHRHQIFCLAQVDDIVRPARYHMNRFNLIAADFKFHGLTSVDVALLNESVPGNHNKQLPLRVVPVLAFCNTRFADIDRNLSTVLGVHQFRKAAAVVHIHLHGVLELVRRQIRQIE